MRDQKSNDTKNSTVVWLGWAFRIACASLAIITIHYLGFFSALADDNFFIISATLVRRVGWELASTLAYTSLLVAIIFLVTGLLKGILLGVARSANIELPSADDWYSIDPLRIAGLYVAMLAVTYFPIDAPTYVRLLSLAALLTMTVLFYLLFFGEVGDGTRWSRFVGPLRHRELAIRALIALALSVSYFSGKGLAWSLMNAEPTQVIADGREVTAVILDVTDTALLIKNDSELALLPMHQIDKVTWPTK